MAGKVELHHCFFFTCDECGFDTFVRFVWFGPEEAEAKLQGEPDREMVEEFLEQVRDKGGAYYPPKMVKCDHCLAEYHDLVLPGDDEHGGEGGDDDPGD